jgi:hypothetical protein
MPIDDLVRRPGGGHPRIDLEDVVTEIRDVRLFAVDPAIVPGNPGARGRW